MKKIKEILDNDKTGKKVYNIKVTEKGKNISINVIGD